MTATVVDAPTHELGHAAGVTQVHTTARGIANVVESLESNPELRFPDSAVIYDRMRREDGQVGSVVRAITYPITSAEPTLVGASDQVRRFIANELGLDARPGTDDEQGRRRRRREGIVFADHLREAVLCLWFGFSPFEQVYTVGEAAPGLEDPERDARLGTNLYAHLRKLAWRSPRTLARVYVGRDGGLEGIGQNPPGVTGLADAAVRGATSLDEVFIPVDRLVVYTNEREGADWTGTSLLRTAYKSWLIKDVLIRLGAQIVERNGMGIPFVSYTEDKDRERALDLARNLRAGAEAGGALAPGMSVSLVGVTGSTADELDRVKYHDEAIGRSLLAMFLNLGHDNGARALGATFVDVFLNAVNAVLRYFEEVITEHIIRDLVELNYGPDEAYPVLRFADVAAESTPTAEALKALADAGLITPDDDLEADLRRRYRLAPKKAAPTSPPIEDGEDGEEAPLDVDVVEAATGDVLVDRLAGLVDRVTALREGHGA